MTIILIFATLILLTGIIFLMNNNPKKEDRRLENTESELEKSTITRQFLIENDRNSVTQAEIR